MNVMELLEVVDRGEIAPVYIIDGPERFLVDDLLRRLRAAVLFGPMADLNASRLKAPEASGAEIVAQARAVPMLAPRRLVLVDDVQKLKAADLDALDSYLAAPCDQTVLVLIADKLDLRKGIIAKANKRGQVHRAEPIAQRQILSFVRARAAIRKVTLGPGADTAIAQAVGADCAALDDAVERVGLFAGPGATATERDVGEVVAAVRQHSVFELADAIGARQHARAIALLEELLARREEPLRLNALLARHFRQLLQARILLSARASERETAQALGVPPFVAKKLTQQCRGFRGASLEAALARLSRADLELKSSRRSGELVLEEAVMDLSLAG